MPDAAERLKLSVRQRGTLGRKARLSLALHVAILLLCLIVLPEPFESPEPTPEGKGAPASVAMVMEVGSAEGVEQPTPSYAPATVAPGETPSMAPPPPMPPSDPTEATATSKATEVPQPTDASQAQSPPPTPMPEPSTATLPAPPAPPLLTEDGTLSPSPSTPTPPRPDPTPALPSPAAARAAPKPVPHIMTTNRLPVPRSHTMKQPTRTANSQGAQDPSPGPQAVNAAGAPPHSTQGQDATTSVDGAAGENGRPPLLDRRSPRPTRDVICSGTYEYGTGPGEFGTHEYGPGAGEHYFPGLKVPVLLHFFRKPDGTPWMTMHWRSRAPANEPVTILGNAIGWTSAAYHDNDQVWPSGNNHLAGQSNWTGKYDLTCDSGLPFR